MRALRPPRHRFVRRPHSEGSSHGNGVGRTGGSFHLSQGRGSAIITIFLLWTLWRVVVLAIAGIAPVPLTSSAIYAVRGTHLICRLSFLLRAFAAAAIPIFLRVLLYDMPSRLRNLPLRTPYPYPPPQEHLGGRLIRRGQTDNAFEPKQPGMLRYSGESQAPASSHFSTGLHFAC